MSVKVKLVIIAKQHPQTGFCQIKAYLWVVNETERSFISWHFEEATAGLVPTERHALFAFICRLLIGKILKNCQFFRVCSRQQWWSWFRKKYLLNKLCWKDSKNQKSLSRRVCPLRKLTAMSIITYTRLRYRQYGREICRFMTPRHKH